MCRVYDDPDEYNKRHKPIWFVSYRGLVLYAICVLIYALLTGCASAPERTVNMRFDNPPREVEVMVRRADFPPGACTAFAAEHVGPFAAAWVAVQIQIACVSMRSDKRAAVMILPYNEPAWLWGVEVAKIERGSK